MKTKLIKVLLPPFVGFLIILGTLMLIAFIRVENFKLIESKWDIYFLGIFVLIALIIAIIIQWTLTIPVVEKFKNNNKVWGLTIIQLTILVCLISGLGFGFFFWERSLGLNELIQELELGLIAFTVYWVMNLLSLKIIDRMLVK
ncbi:hypothetical protein ACFLQ5_00735 [Bacteroidota bacterium]